jgi:hypothetical protein
MAYTFETDSLTASIPIKHTKRTEELERELEKMIKQLTNN